MRPTLVLDLDGTLVDTLPDLRASLNRLMSAHRLDPFDPPAVAAFVGDGVAALVDRAMRARGREPDRSDLDAFMADYGVHATESSKLYPGVAAGLAQARSNGWRIAVCTNKPVALADALLEALGIASLIDAVGGGDSFPVRKPDPAHLLATIHQAGGAPAFSVIVGDHRNDVAAGMGAGVPAIFARWGYGTPDMAAGAAAEADDFAEAMRMADRLVRAPRDTSSHPRTSVSGN